MKVRPYESFCKFKNTNWGQTQKIRYNYSKKTLDKVDWEQEPCREMVIADPSQYHGQLRKKNQWLNSQKVWIVNGQINKLDANFKENFNYSELPGTGIIIGNTPGNEKDIQELASLGVKAVLNLRKSNDYQYMRELYQKNGISDVENFPIEEF